MVKYLPPRSFSDLTAPKDANGRPLLGSDHYDDYVKWLADYLYETEIPLNPRQQAYAFSTDAVDPGAACFRISDWAALASFELEVMEMDLAEGQTWQEYDDSQRSCWNDEVPEDYKEMETYEEWALTQADWERIRDEWLEKKEAGEISTIDMGFRGLLARLLKRLPEKEKRVEILNEFFVNYTETSMK